MILDRRITTLLITAMMHRSVVLLLSLLLTISSRAQLLFGPKAGVNLASFQRSEGSSDGMLLGYMAGVQAEIKLRSSLALAPELIYLQKGEMILPYPSYEKRTYYNYLEIPLLIKYAIGNADKEHLLIAVGPSMGYLTGAKIKGTYPVLGVDREYNSSVDLKGLARVDLGLCIGLGVAIPSSIGAIQLEGRYQFGLTDLDTDDELITRHRGLQIGLAFLFATGKNSRLDPALTPTP